MLSLPHAFYANFPPNISRICILWKLVQNMYKRKNRFRKTRLETKGSNYDVGCRKDCTCAVCYLFVLVLFSFLLLFIVCFVMEVLGCGWCFFGFLGFCC